MQRQAQLQQKAQAAHVSEAPIASSYTHASVTSVLDRPPDYSQSAAEMHRRRRLAQKDLTHEHAHASATTTPLPSFSFPTMSSDRASKFLLGGLAIAMTTAAVAPFVLPEEVGVGAGATQAQAGGVRAVGGTPESQQPLWLQRPRQA